MLGENTNSITVAEQPAIYLQNVIVKCSSETW